MSKKQTKIRLVKSTKNKIKDEFKNKSQLELIQMSKKVLLDLEENPSSENKNRYESLLEYIDTHSYQSYQPYISNLSYYPEYLDDDFNQKIFKKKEFYINKIKTKKIDKNPDLISKELCDPLYNSHGSNNPENIQFNLSQNQKFLKSFLSPQTPYNGALIFHGTGVGKTCTAISIAEQYKEQLQKINKKIIILSSPGIKANFMKNIFDIKKHKMGLSYYQCTGNNYIKEIPNFNDLDDAVIEKRVRKLIKKYYNFYGYQKFANIIDNIIKKVKDKYPEERHEQMINKNISDIFSDTFLIIDEAHNIKEGEGSKTLPPLLERIITNSKNMKLLLLTATPMSDNSREIIWLLNLLLMNDNKPKLNEGDYFDKNGNLKQSRLDKFIKKTRGYISYMRGEDPYRFPERRYPTQHPKYISPQNYPILLTNGERIPEEERLQELHLIGCPMTGFQKNVYQSIEDQDGTFGDFSQPGIMTSIIVFPKNKELDFDTLDDHIGDKGLGQVVEKVNKKYSYQAGFEDFFKEKNLKNYSSKICEIINNIKSIKDEDGIVFIYSKYIASGVIPVALALEEIGYNKYEGALLESKNKESEIGKYIIISGSKDLSKNTYENYIKMESENKTGNKIKIIIGSESAAEGLDFKYIRQIHILDPWFHLNKIEQVIGRGIRNCSHIDLAPKDRNVTIFMYVATKSKNPKDNNETLDLQIYRKAEIKSRQMGKVEYILKKNAVDCNLNREGNIFENDVDYSKKCNYEKCNYTCSPDLSKELNKTELDYDTVNEDNLKDHINDVVKALKYGKSGIPSIFKQKNIFEIDEITNFTNQLNYDTTIVYFAINSIILNQEEIMDKHMRPCNLTYKNGYYILVPVTLKHKSHTINNISYPKKTRKHRAINISNNTYLNELVEKPISFKVSKKSSINTKQPSKSIVSNKHNIIDMVGIMINTDLTVVPQLFRSYNHRDFPESKKIYTYIENFKKIYEKFKVYQNVSVGSKILYQLDNKKNIIDSIPKDQRYKIIDIILNYEQDGISNQKKKQIIEYLISKGSENQTPLENLLYENMYNILRTKDNVYYRDKTYQGNNDVWGYKIVDAKSIVYKKYDSVKKIFIPASKDEITAINKSFKLNNYQRKNMADPTLTPKISAANLIGYMEYKTNKTSFKIREVDVEKKLKKTQIKTGSVCDNSGMKNHTIVKYIQTMMKNDKIYSNLKRADFPPKHFMCKQLEILFRYYDIFPEGKQIRYFYNEEETIEYGVNLKEANI